MSSALLQAVPTAPPSPPAFVFPTLAGRALPRVPEAELAALVEAQLIRLNACEARLDLELAAALSGIAMRDMHLLGHGTREDFARERLGCSWSHVRELLALEKGLRHLPLVREAFLHGALRRARLREILRVATPETEPDWLLLARSLTSSELSARVRATLGDEDDAPAAAAHRFSVRVTPEEAVFIESIGLPMLRAVVGKEGPKHELMAALAAEVLSERGHEPLEDVEGRRGTLREKILRRDGWQCCMPHCRSRRYLEVHHVVYRSRGGSNEKRNLVTACRSCHRLEHLGKLHAMYEGIRQARGGFAPVLVVRVGDRSLRATVHIYREGLRW